MKPELIVNFWAYCDSSTNLLYALSGRAYTAKGTDEEKINLLRSLAPTDYATAKRYELPNRFSVAYGDGTVLKKVAQPQAVHDPNAHLFEEMFANIEAELPTLRKVIGTKVQETPQKLSANPLIVATILYEDEMGNTRPIVTEEDLEWLKIQVNDERQF